MIFQRQLLAIPILTIPNPKSLSLSPTSVQKLTTTTWTTGH